MHNTLKFDANNKVITCNVHSSLSSLKSTAAACEAKSEMSNYKST